MSVCSGHSFSVLLDYVIYFIQLEDKDREVKTQVTLFMVIAVLQTHIQYLFVFFTLLLLVLADYDLSVFILVTGGRGGFGGQMQPGVFHGYPLKSPKAQGMISIYRLLKS